MNKARRKRVSAVVKMLWHNKIEEAKAELEDILWDEQDAFDNMPENLQYSMRGEESQECIEAMESALDILREITDNPECELSADDAADELILI